MRRAILGLLIATTLTALAAAQQPSPASGLASATITGQIVTADTGTPVRGAQVRLRAAGGDTRLAITDERGRFEARDLFAGNWVVAVSKNGFVTARYLQRRASDDGKPIPLKNGERADISIAMQRAGAITGRVLDEFGDPLLGARIQAMRQRVVRGVRQLMPVGASDTTDDTGGFRVFGLQPGTYYVSAMLRGLTPDTDLAQNTIGAMQMHYPGTGDVGEAQAMVLHAGEEMTVAFQTAPVRSVRISGVVFGTDGAPAANTSVRLMRLDGNEVGTTVGNFGQSGPDGSFTIINVPPGPYILTASRMGPPQVRPGVNFKVAFEESSAAPINVSGDDIGGVTLALALPTTVSGTIVAESGTTLPSPLRVEITAIPAIGSSRNPAIIQVNRVSGQPMTFQMPGMLGAVTLGVNLPDGLMLAGVESNGVDVTDRPIELLANAPEIRAGPTTKVTEVSGMVTSGRTPAGNVSVVVFPEDRTKWAFPSRYVTFADADDHGRFVIRRLPGRERYLAAVVTALDDGDQFDPELLEALRLRATAFTLGEAERKALSLTIERATP